MFKNGEIWLVLLTILSTLILIVPTILMATYCSWLESQQHKYKKADPATLQKEVNPVRPSSTQAA